MSAQLYVDTLIQDMLAGHPLLPVVTLHDIRHALPLAEAFLAGGLPVLEITLRTEAGLPAIHLVRQQFPELRVGAGTVLNAQQYQRAEDAGAEFVVSPGITTELLDRGEHASVPLLPGVSTLSEVLMGYNRGWRAFKLFPAAVAGGVAALKAFSAPLSDAVFCPTGGVDEYEAPDYLALANVFAVGGSWLTPPVLLEREDWAGITAIVRRSLALLREVHEA
ncbi:MAG: bifunctional 4-hydroxy-2-oxoglutarate aldolase/2-dehydro-3-deoxy-phosphogluconate aldolase [Marinobacter sp.]|nr:bifunctional 4-hydroxy-2-oxoglutarate aldolase/2-dehydro-3-deoxy-phosphogluconate aldolase [Marinobacter sp.]